MSMIFSLIKKELDRQNNTINLIASENYVSKAVLEATGSVLTNKYAEGYSSKRYYGGCQVIDEVENYAIDLGKKLFGADHINVQPHSGSTANFAVYFSCLKPGDTVLGMNLGAGGHLTHGHKINFSGSLFNFIHYSVDPETECINYDEVERLANQHKPKMIVAGASAYARLIDYEKFAAIAQSVNAFLLVDMAHIAGPIAAGVIPSPIPYADFVSSTTHKTLRGPRGGIVCAKASRAAMLDKAVMPGVQGGPLMHVIAAKAAAFEEALQPSFKMYQEQVIANAKAMVDAFLDRGYRVVTGGTDTHLFLVDLRSKSFGGTQLSGRQAEEILMQCNIILNRNMVPFDTQSPLVTSGIRIGTPAMTTRGMKETDALDIVALIDDVLTHHADHNFLRAIESKVAYVCKQFPVY